MNRYVLSPLARTDLVGIFGYIAEHNLSAARNFQISLHKRFALLARHPQMGELRRDLEDISPKLRSISAGRYVIYFRPISNGIEIVRILHGSRDQRRALGD